MFPNEYNYKLTSTARSKSIKQIGHPTLDISRDSFRWRAARSYNQLPASIRNEETLPRFKIEAKKWIRNNTPVHGSQD